MKGDAPDEITKTYAVAGLNCLLDRYERSKKSRSMKYEFTIQGVNALFTVHPRFKSVKIRLRHVARPGYSIAREITLLELNMAKSRTDVFLLHFCYLFDAIQPEAPSEIHG